MDDFRQSDSDSRVETGGTIPGTAGIPCWQVTGPRPSRIPVVIAVPHAGREYPGEVLARMRDAGRTTLRLEDRLADRLGAAVAARTSATLLVACAPRAMIDLNRAPDDIDWDMFAGVRSADRALTAHAAHAPNRRARSGLGLVPRRLPVIGEIWKQRHQPSELAARLDHIHAPYHARLDTLLRILRARWGAALLVDLHSMPPLPQPGGGPGPAFVLGDRFGTSCDGRLVAAAFAHFTEARQIAAHNRPYAGGYVLERHAAPARGIHAMQIEVDRARYLDSRLSAPGPGFTATVEVLAGLVDRLAAETAILARNAPGWAEAAE